MTSATNEPGRASRVRAPGAAKEQQEEQQSSSSLSSYSSFTARKPRERAQALRLELRKRGIYNPATLMRGAGPEAIEGAIRWFDEQRARSTRVSPGVLANAIRDGGMPGYGAPAPELACSSTPELAGAWDALAVRLAEAFGQTPYEVWIARLHPHAHADGGWVLGGSSAVVSWVRARYGRGLAQVLGEPVAIVVCDRGGR